MNENDLEIGPCWTDLNYRGQGIYPYVIQTVIKNCNKKFNDFYMIVDEKNTPSIKGIEKAGFQRVGEIRKSKIMGIYENEY